MTILGVITAVTITVFKPHQYKEEAFNTLKKKVYTDVDAVLTTIISECSADTSLKAVYKDCNHSKATFTIGIPGAKGYISKLIQNYARGTLYPKGEERNECNNILVGGSDYISYPAIKLRNGVCLYFLNSTIEVDVNGNEGPNKLGADVFRYYYSHASGEPALSDMESSITSAIDQTCTGTGTCTCVVNGAIQTSSQYTIYGCAAACNGAGGYMENYTCE